jgi:tetratricopeptide (TPR) repeat protein
MEHTSKKLHILLICLALAFITLFAFEQVRQCEFTATDDVKFAAENSYVQAGLTRESIAYAFTTKTTANWMPLTWLSVMLDSQIFGPSSKTFHLMNLLYHLVAVVLLFIALNKMTGAVWRSAFVAAAFALHPLRVESVAWVAERKDVLSGVFWMLTMLAYIRYAQRPNIRRYLLVALSFSLGLMAKPMLVTLPFVLLLLDYWPLGRLRLWRQKTVQELADNELSGFSCKKSSLGRLVTEKVPLFILVGASCIITVIVQQAEGAVRSLERYSIGVRISNALVSYIIYIGKTIWPERLAFWYPHPGAGLAFWKAVIALLILFSISAGLIYTVLRRRELGALVVGWFWFLGTLIPVIGLVQVGEQSMADRYTYLPSIGISIMVAWGFERFSRRLRRRNMLLGISAFLLLTTWVLCTRLQVGYWKNTLALFGHTVEVTRNNYRVHYHYADALLKEGRLDEAALHFQQSLRINPMFEKPYSKFAMLLNRQGRFDEAISLCKKQQRIGKPDAAIYHRLGMAYARKGLLNEAIESFKESIRLSPDSAPPHDNVARLVMSLRNPDTAVRHLTEAIRLNPNIALTHFNLALIFKSKGMTEEAVTHFREALRVKPNWEQPMNSLAWILATHNNPKVRDPQEAVNLARQACELTDYQNPGFLDTLAAAYAAAGRFSDAVSTAEKALQIIASGDKKKRALAVQNRLDLYRQQKTYRQP